MKENIELSKKIQKIIKDIRPQPNEISFAVINLKEKEPRIAGYNMDTFIYPASVYKVFIGAEVLRRVDQKLLSLEKTIKIKPTAELNKNSVLFPKSTTRDHRPMLTVGDTMTIDHLLDLVFSRSDNTASNALIELVGIESIEQNIVLPNGWQGSGVTKDFIERDKTKPFRFSDTTLTCARHLAELFYKIEMGTLVNEWVSGKLKEYMFRWNRNGRGGFNIPEFEGNYYRKGGLLETNGYKHNFFRTIAKIFNGKGYAINRWINDVGVIKTEDCHYVVAVLTRTQPNLPWRRFHLKDLSKKIYQLIKGD